MHKKTIMYNEQEKPKKKRPDRLENRGAVAGLVHIVHLGIAH